MKSRKGCPQQRGKSTKYRFPVVCLLVVSVLAPLVFLGRKASNFNPTLDRREFLEGFPSGKRAESGRLNAFDQIETLFPKSVLDVIIKHSEESEASDSNLLSGNPAWLHQPTFDLLANSTSFSEDGVFEDHGQVLYGEEGRTGMVVQGARRGLRLRREKERLAELTQQDEEERERLEREAFKRAKEVDAPIIGKYSIWRREDSENSDSVVRLMRDQLIMARIYLSIAKAHNNAPLMRELKLKIRESLRAMGGATIDSDLSRSAPEKIRAMGLLLARAREEHYDCNAIVRKLRAMLQTAEEYGRTLKKRSTFLSQLAAKTIPKGLHCLSLRLNVDYYNLDEEQQEFPGQDKLEDPSLYHYALFSDNVLATSVVVNSTVLHAREPEKHVFHLVTDKLNYGAMKMWFLANPPRNATIHVQNIDDFKWLNSSYCPVLRQLESAAMKEYYFKPDQPTSLSSGTTNLKYRNPKYLSMLNHLRFYLPQIYPKLDKLLFLDDDIVVQKDLTALWKIDLQGKVNGAVETCGASFHRFDKYLNFSNPHIARNFDPNACGWAYGMNVFDLKEWKRQDITGIYHRWQNMNEERLLWKLGTLPPGLITFYNLTYPLDKTWHVLGLGYNPGIDKSEIDEAAVIHYNGNLKPWLDIGLARFKYFWAKYVKYDHPALQQCNIVH